MSNVVKLLENVRKSLYVMPHFLYLYIFWKKLMNFHLLMTDKIQGRCYETKDHSQLAVLSIEHFSRVLSSFLRGSPNY